MGSYSNEIESIKDANVHKIGWYNDVKDFRNRTNNKYCVADHSTLSNIWWNFVRNYIIDEAHPDLPI